MKLLQVALAVLTAQTIAAHTIFTTLFINDVNQGDGVCIRMNTAPDTSTSPVRDLTSNDMACGIVGEVGVARVCPASKGSKLSFLWREWADGSQPGSIDISHKGPCAVYMKAVSSAISNPGYGAGWFKIWESGYNNETAQWCTETLIQNGGFISIDIPGDLAGGYYLVRPELLALHEVNKNPPDPQFYVGCAQIFLQSNGLAVPSNDLTVSIPGYVNAGDASVNFNIYDPAWPYPMLGPAPYVEGVYKISGLANAVTDSAAAMSQEEGLVPAGCVVENANWCGIELDSYNTEGGCWNASSACWRQAKACYSSAPPTGDTGCRIWETKCTSIQDACNAGSFTGPPNKDMNLNPTLTATYVIPPPANEPKKVLTSPVGVAKRSPAPGLLKEARAFIDDTTNPQPTVTDNFPFIPDAATPTPVVGNSPFPTSKDASCGALAAHSCPGGECCSQWGWCGITEDYCGDGCQPVFGNCWELA